QTVPVKGAIYVRVPCQPTREHDNRIVAAIAVPREFDAFGADQDVDARAVERRAEGVGVQRLAPLAIGFLVAMAAVLGFRESAWLNKIVALDGSIAGEGQIVLAEKKVVGLADFVGVILAFGVFGGLGAGDGRRGSYEAYKGSQETGGTPENSPHLRFHDDLPARPNKMN